MEVLKKQKEWIFVYFSNYKDDFYGTIEFFILEPKLLLNFRDFQ